MQRPSIGAAAITALVLSAILAVSALAATKTISVGDDVFSPKSVSIAKGTTVRWVWRGRHRHNVTVVAGPAKFSSPTQRKGSYSRRLSRTGTYRIICTIHGAKQSLSIRVR